MSRGRIVALNLAGLALALGLGVVVARVDGTRGEARAQGPAGESAAFLVDATGARVPVRPYRRIVSGSHVADHLLVALVERDRIAGLSGNGAAGAADPHLFAGIPVFDRLHDVEALVALRPDIVVVNNFVHAGTVTQLRDAGLEVFDLGHMRGLATLLENARTLAALVGVPERGERFAARFEARMRAVAADVPASARPRAIYLGAHGATLFGGTRGTSYHDVLVHGGLVDAAAERYFGWPALTSEQILELDPEVVVTPENKARVICDHPGLSHLRPCRGEGKIVEVPESTLLDPGPPMLEAAELVRRAVHGPPPAPEAAR